MGRTARAGRSGVAISLVNVNEVYDFFQIEKLIGMYLLPYGSLKLLLLLLHSKKKVIDMSSAHLSLSL